MRIFAGSYQGQICVLEGLPSSLQLRASKHLSDNSIRALAHSQGQLIAGGYDQQLRTVNQWNGSEEKQSKESKGIINCIAGVNEKMTAIGLDNGNICFWDVNNWVCKKTIREHKKGVSDIKRDAKGVLLVSVAGREMIFWNIANLSALYHYKFDFDISHVLLVQSFQYLFLIGDRTIRQMSTDQNKLICQVDTTEKFQCGLVYLDFLLVATEKGEIKIWKHGNLEHCIHFKAHQGRIKAMKIVKIDEVDYLITAQSNGEISVWDILQFLAGVDSISQDYPLEGLKAISSVKIKQRIISLEAISIVNTVEKAKEKKEVQKEEQEKQVAKVEKKKKINKKSKNGNNSKV